MYPGNMVLIIITIKITFNVNSHVFCRMIFIFFEADLIIIQKVYEIVVASNFSIIIIYECKLETVIIIKVFKYEMIIISKNYIIMISFNILARKIHQMFFI